jgi:hypothetical protein
VRRKRTEANRCKESKKKKLDQEEKERCRMQIVSDVDLFRNILGAGSIFPQPTIEGSKQASTWWVPTRNMKKLSEL